MPIKGLTTNVKPRFPSLGKLRKGEERTQEDLAKNRPGEDLPGTFRFVGADSEIEKAFIGAYGLRPSSLSVFLPNKALDDNWEAWQEHWVAGGLRHRCDGETCVLWQDDQGKYHTDPKPCPGECKPGGYLQLLLPELLRAGYVGYVTFETHSKNDIMSLQACMEDAAAKSNGHGLQGIEFRLYRVEQAISTPGANGNRMRRKKSLVKITPSVRWVQSQLASAERLALGEPEPLRALPEPQEVDVEDGEYDEIEDGEFDDEPEPFGVDLYAMREQLREAANGMDGQAPSRIPSAPQKGLLVNLIEKASGHTGDAANQDRHLALQFLYAKPSTSGLSYGEVYALLRALVDAERSDRDAKRYEVSEAGRLLITAAIAEQMRLKGQVGLFDEEIPT